MTMDRGTRGRGMGDEIIYYRRPMKDQNGRPLEHAGWITWADSLSGTKLRDYTVRGFEPLTFLHVRVNSKTRDAQREEEGWSNDRYIWEPILTHPDGPALFPVDQILAYRWHHPDQCPIPDVVFPQLVGKKVRELRCPERCGRAPFIEYDGYGAVGPLASHLRIMHEWDRTALIAWGETVGIDFNQPDVGGDLIEEFTFEAYEAKRERSRPKAQVEVETV